ncbi:MAG: PfkB family carbohydrate kinase [Kiritimatiellaeota bacterium]|nr:PfkB family carbohydrate kinase [Kiritimatiellota bacterium]
MRTRGSNHYDIIFLGHMCYDEITPYQGQTRVAPGSAVLCGALAAVRTGKRVAVAAKMAPADASILQPLRDAGIDVYLIPAAETTWSVVMHPVPDVDVRQLILKKSAGLIRLEEVPPLEARCLHLAGISDTEFDLNLIAGLARRGYSLSADMQSFVRQVDPVTRAVVFKDVPDKRELVRQLAKIKLDAVEAEVLTGTADIEEAARLFEMWGCPETIITRADGVLARVAGKTYFEKFSNRNLTGRTGRGDTTFAAYLARRLDHGAADALKFAAALVSIKMETPGPFSGTLEDVLVRMKEQPSGSNERSAL